MDADAVLSLIKKECKNSGVKLYLGRGNSVLTGGMACSGYFDENPPTLAVAIGKSESEYLPVLIHEYNHMQQWKEQSTVWVNLDGSCELLDEWMSGKDYPADVVNKAIDRIIDVELDCERRVVAFITTNDIDIDVQEYIQKSNSYVLFYNVIRFTRKWYKPERRPYQVDAVWKSMPEVFGDNNYELTPEQRATFEQL